MEKKIYICDLCGTVVKKIELTRINVKESQRYYTIDIEEPHDMCDPVDACLSCADNFAKAIMNLLKKKKLEA